MPLKRDLFRQYRDFIEGLGSSGIQEVRENCIDDIRKGKSVHAKTLFALVTEDKAALEDTIRSMSDLRFSAFAHEFHQNLDVSLSYLTMTDQAFEEGYKGAEVIDEQLSRSRRVEGQQKRAILLIAQAGAGKSWLVEHFLQAFVGDFGAVVIDQDPWRFKLSDYVSRLKENESEAIAASQIITNKWVNDLLDVAIDEEDRDILFCTMLGSNVSAIIQLAQRLHKAGYIVEVQAMAVNQFISNMGAISRREEEIQQYGGGRSVASEKQSMAYYNIITGLNFFEKSKQLVKKLALIDRDAQPLFEKSLLDSGDWNKPGFIEDELIRWREREISQKEEERHCENFERTLFLQYSREASVAEKVHTEKSILDALHYFARSRLPEEPSEQKENDLWEEAQEKLVNIKKRANKLREEAIERDHELVRSATISMRDGNLFTEDGKQYSKLLQLKASRLPIDASLEYLRILVAIVSTPTADIPGLLGNVNPGKRAQLFDATKEQLKQAATHYLTKTHPAIIFSPSFTKEEKRTMFLSFADAFRTPAIDQLSAAAQQASEAGNQLESEIEKEIKEDNEKINVAFTAAQNNKLFDDGGVSYRECLGVTASYLTPDSLSRFAIILHKGLTELPDHLNPGENHQLLMTSESARDSLAQFYIDAMHNNMSATGLSVGERTQYSLNFLKLLTASPPINQVSQNACELIAAYFVDAGPKELRTIELKQLFELTRFFAHLDGSPIYSD
ncbi:MAG TPA: zeta toxin family protein, partial [Burkholderiales bacterium]|nr:zeta toxin family protein [Burkholderiales bacterium]